MSSHRPVTRLTRLTGCTALLSLASSSVFASGFALIEQSVSSMGTAYAGAGSISQDASTVFFNPASMSRLEGRQLSAGLHVVVPESDFTGSAAYNPSHPVFNPPSPAAGFNGVPVQPGADNDTDGGETGYVPHFTYVQDINNQWKFGLSVNVPFGLRTEYGTGWVGRYSAIESEITSINLNPTLSFKVDERTTIGFGVSAMYASLDLKNAVDVGLNATLAGAPIPGWIPGTSTFDAIAEIDVDDWGYGWNVGALFEPTEHTRYGLAYRSEVEVELDGDLSSTNQTAIPNTSARVDASLPDTLLLSAYHELNPQWSVMADIMWTQWSKIDALVARFGSGSTNTIPLKWDDSMRYAIGASYKHSDQWTYRTGIALDETPVPSQEFRPAALPDEDRLWLTLGAGYQYSKQLGFDFGYAHLFIDDPEINSTDAYSSQAGPFTTGFHRLTGDYDASVDMFSAQANWKF